MDLPKNIKGLKNKTYPLLSDNWYEIRDYFGEDSGGVYVLFLEKDSKIMPVSRLLSNDENGILYIGMTVSFLDRPILLKKTIANKTETGHDCGLLYNKLSDKENILPRECLKILLIEHSDPMHLEYKLLQQYFNSFGELPPFNRNKGSKQQ